MGEMKKAATNAEPGIVPPSKLSHIVLKTSRLVEMREWYMSVLGARVLYGNDRIAFLTFDKEHHRLALVQMDGLEKPAQFSTGLDHVAFTYDDLGTLLSTYKRLKAIGIAPRWPVNHGMTTSLYYQDPDGNRVELQFENYPTEDELLAFIEGPEFAANPMGGAFAPEELIRRFENGEPIYPLVRGIRDPKGPSPEQILKEMDLFRT
jgi:catechol 2,3-dioxygenase-like lactoylglutathione lyase family enzyme